MDDHNNSKMIELKLKSGLLRVNRNRMLFGSISCTLVHHFFEHSELICNEFTQLLSVYSSIGVIAFCAKALVDNHKLYKVEEEYQKAQREHYSQKVKKTYVIDNQ